MCLYWWTHDAALTPYATEALKALAYAKRFTSSVFLLRGRQYLVYHETSYPTVSTLIPQAAHTEHVSDDPFDGIWASELDRRGAPVFLHAVPARIPVTDVPSGTYFNKGCRTLCRHRQQAVVVPKFEHHLDVAPSRSHPASPPDPRLVAHPPRDIGYQTSTSILRFAAAERFVCCMTPISTLWFEAFTEAQKTGGKQRAEDHAHPAQTDQDSVDTFCCLLSTMQLVCGFDLGRRSSQI